MATLGYFLGEALTSMNRSRGVSFLAAATIGIALSMLGGFLYVSANFSALLESCRQELQLNVYLRDDISDAELEGLQVRLRSDPAVEGMRHVTKAQALEQFRVYFTDLRDLPDVLGSNPLPASLEVRLAEGEQEPAAVRRLSESIEGLPGVENVQYDTGWVERLHSMVRLASGAGYVVGAILLLAATFTASNVIRLALYSRRDEVDILQLVGATRGFIQGPFLVEGIVQGLLGGALALGLIATVHLSVHAAPESVGVLARVATERFLGPGAAVALVLGGGGMGLAGSFLAVRKFLVPLSP